LYRRERFEIILLNKSSSRFFFSLEQTLILEIFFLLCIADGRPRQERKSETGRKYKDVM
jgi:hypothetical protein